MFANIFKPICYATLALGLISVAPAQAEYYYYADAEEEEDADPTYESNRYDNYNNYNAMESRKNNAMEFRNTTDTTADKTLTDKINSKIGPGWFFKGYDRVIVQVNNGNVLLTGFVKTWDEKDTVENEVRKIQGVRSLNSQIHVDAPIKQ